MILWFIFFIVTSLIYITLAAGSKKVINFNNSLFHFVNVFAVSLKVTDCIIFSLKTKAPLSTSHVLWTTGESIWNATV